jgi:hypothetical protein
MPHYQTKNMGKGLPHLRRGVRHLLLIRHSGLVRYLILIRGYKQYSPNTTAMVPKLSRQEMYLMRTPQSVSHGACSIVRVGRGTFTVDH